MRSEIVRLLPPELGPVADQALLNLAEQGLIKDPFNAAIIEVAGRTNAAYDAWLQDAHDNRLVNKDQS